MIKIRSPPPPSSSPWLRLVQPCTKQFYNVNLRWTDSCGTHFSFFATSQPMKSWGSRLGLVPGKFILYFSWNVKPLIVVKMILHESNFKATESNCNTRSLHAEYSLHPTLISWVLKLSCLPAGLPPAASGVPAWLGWAQKPLTDTLSSPVWTRIVD